MARCTGNPLVARPTVLLRAGLDDAVPSFLAIAEQCKLGGIVQGDEGPVGGVAQVVCHGVIVVVGHQEEGQEEKGEKQGEVEGEVEKLKDNRTSWMVCGWNGKH